MNKHLSVFRTTLAVLTGVFLYACTYAAAAPRYEIIIPEQRIPVADSAADKWVGRDLTIEYRYTADGRGLSISGVIDFADSIKYNYEWARSFNASLIFGDAEGRVLGTGSLTTTRLSGTDRWDPVRFSQRLAMPPGAATFAFGYSGEVVESGGGGGRRGRGGGGGNLTSIWNYPLRKVSQTQR